MTGTIKTDDAGRWVRKARNRLTKEIEGMTAQEQVDYINNKAREVMKQHNLQYAKQENNQPV
jgi:hypothetical protein